MEELNEISPRIPRLNEKIYIYIICRLFSLFIEFQFFLRPFPSPPFSFLSSFSPSSIKKSPRRTVSRKRNRWRTASKLLYVASELFVVRKKYHPLWDEDISVLFFLNDDRTV